MPRSSVLDRHVGRNRPRIDQWRWRLGLDRTQRAVVIQEFVENALDRCLCPVRTGIAHVVMLDAGLYDRNARLLTDFFRRNDARVRLEHRILRRSEEHTSEL